MLSRTRELCLVISEGFFLQWEEPEFVQQI